MNNPSISWRRGQIWLVRLDPTIGAEIRKTRPAAIANNDAMGILPLKIIVPITQWQDPYTVRPWMSNTNYRWCQFLWHSRLTSFLRSGLIWIMALGCAVVTWVGAGAAVIAEDVTPHLTQDVIQQIDQLFQQAFTATNEGDFETAETYWTQALEQVPQNPAAWSNRGNARLSQNKLQEAIADYNQAIEIAPEQPDAYLNRGIARERLSQWQAAIADYNQVLDLDPQDPVAYNNRGNAEAGLGDWSAAIADYDRAAEMAPDYAFARANYALALYQTGQTLEAIRTMRNLIRKYPKFADMRAALAAALWVDGQQDEAESNWVAVMGLDQRYKDLSWVTEVRRWPPTMVTALDKFLTLE